MEYWRLTFNTLALTRPGIGNCASTSFWPWSPGAHSNLNNLARKLSHHHATASPRPITLPTFHLCGSSCFHVKLRRMSQVAVFVVFTCLMILESRVVAGGRLQGLEDKAPNLGRVDLAYTKCLYVCSTAPRSHNRVDRVYRGMNISHCYFSVTLGSVFHCLINLSVGDS